MIPSSKRMWLGSSILAGLILASSLPAFAMTQTQTATISSPKKPLLVVSSNIPTGTYTEAVRKQMKWFSTPEIITAGINPSVQSIPTQSDLAIAVADQSLSNQSQEPKQPTNNSQKPVQVAAANKQQVSRSDNSEIVDHALSLVGVPYVFGGSSRSGFDCSGYTQYVFKGSGISLARSSFDQFHSGSSVSRDQLKSGDLVFFNTYTSGASHVGIYIGGGRFVHASNSGVRVTSLNDSYYASRYLGARRES